MPFDPAPQVKVGRFQNVADAMLRGCAISKPTFGQWQEEINGMLHACAMGAIAIGNGGHYPCNIEEAFNAYRLRYGSGVMGDNDSGRFTREEIAARIAAL